MGALQQERGKFPSQPQANPQGQHQVVSSSGFEPLIEHLKAITTLRSGKEIDKTILPKPSQNKAPSHTTSCDHSVESPSGDTDKEKRVVGPSNMPCPIPAPFPQRLRAPKRPNNHAEIYMLFEQVKINILLLDAIKQIPVYANFLKDLCIVKRNLNVYNKAFLMEQTSSIIQTKTVPKYKDPGCPTISIVIGDTKIEHALLNLGASVNLFPYSVYEKLGLGELKPTSVALQLADRSIRIPRGVVEDVLVQVEKFYFLVNFVVLDMQPVANPENQIPVILGHPFLSTFNAFIQCRNGIVRLAFGNMTLELNIFNVAKQVGDKGEIHELVLERCEEKNLVLN
ncbi:uncharacterized protein LOC130751468 [Actinidia eriantha]|uniref:uncharacterized protein LOC130751468 n=1 Tax=Actinidia eriantha TaxID=165200 RepID=UPI00258FDA22|nr:uncharacterized protein LOC130751468 [Actinidia eriantha]